MKSIISFLFVAMLLISAVQAIDYYDAEYLIVNSTVSIPVAVTRSSGIFSFDYLTVNYSWLPVIDYRQEVKAINTKPESENLDGTLVFNIQEAKDFTLKINFLTNTSSKPVKIRNKVEFPINRLESDLLEYTKPSKLVDINDNIRSVASSLARGEDDLYVVVFKIGDWVNTNIEYNLSTFTSEATLPSSWVLRERQGVCDELSNLFVSMLRSLGIPARTVTGISYTDSEIFDFNWGAHGWTEVYFPGYGWVPFDPTYNQLGYVDATHIKLGNKKGDERFNTEFEWKGRGFDVEPSSQSVESEVLKYSESKNKEISMDVSFMRNSVGFDSYNVVVANIRNMENYYVTRVLDISRVQGIEIMDEVRRDVLLKPKEEKKVYWIVRVDKDLNQRYVYTFPFTVFTNFNETVNEDFRTSKMGEQVTLKAAQAYSANGDTEISASQMQCYPVEESVYMKEKAEITCIFGNKNLQQAKICIESSCETKNIVEGQASRKIIMSEPGIRTFIVEAEAPGFMDESFVTIEVIDAASILLRNLSISNYVRFNETATIDFIAMRESSSVPRNVSVKIIHDLFEKEWILNSLEQTQGFRFYIKGKDMKVKDNIIKIEVTYYDSKGRRYVTERSGEIKLIELSFFQRVRLWINSLGILVK